MSSATLGMHGVVRVVREPARRITDDQGHSYYRQRIHLYRKGNDKMSVVLFSDDDEMWKEEEVTA